MSWIAAICIFRVCRIFVTGSFVSVAVKLSGFSDTTHNGRLRGRMFRTCVLLSPSDNSLFVATLRIFFIRDYFGDDLAM